MPEPIVRYFRFIRPFTLLVPALGMVCGALMGLSVDPKGVSDWSPGGEGIFLRTLAGAVLAASLNAFSNGLNQIFDLEIDRVNKPHRLLPSGRISMPEAWCLSLLFLVIALLLAAWVNLPVLSSSFWEAPWEPVSTRRLHSGPSLEASGPT